MAAEAIVAGVLRAVAYQASSLALQESRVLGGAKGEIEKLKTTISLLQSFLADAHKREQAEDSVLIWLQDLQDASLDAEDILDELNAGSARLEAYRAQTTWIGRLGGFLLSCFTCSGEVPGLFIYRLARRVVAIREKLDFIVQEGNKLGFHRSKTEVSKPSKLGHWGESSSLVLDSEVVGRSNEKAKLLILLLNSAPTMDSAPVTHKLNFEVVYVVGMGGLGKTTLAGVVFNHEKVRAHFKLRVWMQVSGNPNPTTLLSEIIESIIQKRPKLTTLDNLQNSLVKLLRSKLFLLVLDGVWNEQTIWNALRIPLHSGRSGSRVVITSRNQGSSLLLPDISSTSINLEALSFKSCWSIFQRYVHVDGSPLETLGREIVQKARGIPLVTKALGSLAKSYGMDEKRWKRIVKDDVPQPVGDEMHIISILRLSYDHLPAPLKQCFAFCAVFPKGYVFDKAMVVNMWMALGFVQAHGGQRMEDVGSDYFDDLLRASFFDPVQIGLYKMHDFMHSLAQSVSGDQCFSIPGGDPKADPCKVRHISLTAVDSQALKELQKFTKLRSLLFLKQYEALPVGRLGDLLKKLRCLRALDLGCVSKLSDSGTLLGALRCFFLGDHLKQFPKSIGSLKLLRFLRVSVDDIGRLPGSICELYNLQNISLKDCKKDLQLPKEMFKLVNLRHFDVDPLEVFHQIFSIGKLTALQELQKLSVGTTAGSKIGELQNLNDLQGRLSISNLENVASAEEASEARLEDKQYIDHLELEWSGGSKASKLHEDVLDCLKPHYTLKALVIKNYGGIRSPRWLENTSLPFLESVHLVGCQWWKVLPPLGQLPFLQTLELSGMDGGRPNGWFEFLNDPDFEGSLIERNGLKGRWFPELRRLRISSTLKLFRFPVLPPTLTEMQVDTRGFTANMIASKSRASWIFASPSSSSSSSSPDKALTISQHGELQISWTKLLQHHLGALKELSISNCNRLSSLPLEALYSLPVTKLSIDNCPLLRRLPLLPCALQQLELCRLDLGALPEIHGAPADVMSENEAPLPSLSCLKIAQCSALHSVREGLLNQKLVALKTLIIHDCRCLRSWPQRGFESLVNLKCLEISECPEMAELPPLPPGLLYLGLNRLRLRTVPEFFHCSSPLPSLRKLEISDCPDLASLSVGLLQKEVEPLEELFVCHCVKLKLVPSLERFTSLRTITFVGCPNLAFVPTHTFPDSITELEIDDCSLLTEQRQEAGTSSWPEITCPQLIFVNGRWRRKPRAKRTFDGGKNYGSGATNRSENQRRRRVRVMEMVIRDIFPCCF